MHKPIRKRRILMPPKTKSNYSAANMPDKDKCATPPYALEPLLPYIPEWRTIWEPACGEMLLVNALREQSRHPVIGSDILYGDNFFEIDLLDNPHEPRENKIIITNPPFSLKYKWLARCYELGYPFALLVPVDTLGAGTAMNLFEKHGVEVIFMKQRIDFRMPRKGWAGTSDFNSVWLTWGLNIGRYDTYVDISVAKKAFKESLREVHLSE
jgi:hypothetical protein